MVIVINLLRSCMYVYVIAGEWWNGDVVGIERKAAATGASPKISDAYTINGLPGDLYNCSQDSK
jgi:laccase